MFTKPTKEVWLYSMSKRKVIYRYCSGEDLYELIDKLK